MQLPNCFPCEPFLREPVLNNRWWSERHLQCIWLDDHLRPPLVTTCGLPIEVIDSGQWNGLAGPDFHNATLRIAGEVVKGDVEIHIRSADWYSHGHDTDPNYSNVVLHVAWDPPKENEVAPEIPLAILRDAMLMRPGFSFDQIDTDFYPWATDTAQRPCQNALSGYSSTELGDFLEEAGARRIARKTNELITRIQRAGSTEQAFYADTLAALGFRANTVPMRALAEALPVHELCHRAVTLERYSLLLGAAGLLPHDPTPAVPQEWLTALWNACFLAGGVDNFHAAKQWSLNGLRPVNHPRVRLAIAACYFSSPDALLTKLSGIPRDNPKQWVKDCEKLLKELAEPATELLPSSYKLESADTLKRKPGVLGKGRIHAFLTNVLIPFLAIQKIDVRELLRVIPGEDLGNSMKEMALRLFGRDHNPALYSSSALRMQGLLEIWKGYCTATSLACRDCAFRAKEIRNA